MDELDALDSLDTLGNLDELDNLDSLSELDSLDIPSPSEVTPEVPEAPEAPATSSLSARNEGTIGKVIEPQVVKQLADKWGKDYNDIADLMRIMGGHVGELKAPEESDLTKSIVNLANKSPEILRPVLDVMGFASSREVVDAIKAAPMELMGVLNRSIALAPLLINKAVINPEMSRMYDDLLAEVEATRGKADVGAEITAGLLTGSRLMKPAGAALTAGAQAAMKVPVIAKAVQAVAPAVAREAVEEGTKLTIKQVAKHVASTAAVGGAMGGTFGAATAKTGDELEAGLEGALTGALLNVGLSGLLQGVAFGGGKVINKFVNARALTDLSNQAGINMAARRETEAKLFELFKSGKSDLTETEIDKIFGDLKIGKGKWKKFLDMSEADETVRTFNAKSDYLEHYVNRNMFKFASEFLPLATGTKLNKINVMDLLDGIATDRKLRKFLGSESNRSIPTQVREKFLGQLQSGTDWEIVKYDLVKWAEGRLKSNQLDLFNMTQVQRAIKKAGVETGSPEYIDNLWRIFRTYEEMGSLARKSKVELGKASWVGRAIDAISATHHVTTNIERKFGVPLSIPQINLNRQLEGFAAKLPEYEAKFIVKSGLDKAISDLESRKLWDADLFFKYMEAGDDVAKQAGILNQFPAAARDTIEFIGKAQREAWDGLLAEAKHSYGINIKPFEAGGYMRHQIMSPIKAIGRVFNMSAKVLGGKFKELNPSTKIGTIKDEAFQEFASALKFLSGKTLRTVDDMKSALTEISNLEATSDRVLSIMGSVKARAQLGGIPDVLLEKDPRMLIESWMNDVFKKALTREPLMQLHGAVKTLRSLSRATGDEADVAANQVLNIIRAASGANAGLTSRKVMNRLTVDKILDKYRLAADPQSVDDLIDGFSSVQNIIGTSVISSLLLKPATAVKQMLQPMVFAAEELGGTPYMRELGARASFKTWLDWPNAVKDLGRRSLAVSGKVPKKYKGERPTPTGSMGKWERRMEKFSNAALFTFGIAERMNRLTTIKMVDYLYRDALKGNTEALKFMREGIESKGVREQVNKFMREGKHFEARDVLEDYILQRTMFTYNEVNKAQFAREVGPMLSMLTRVPTEVVGDITSKVRSGNASKAIRKYLGPLMYLWEMDLLLKDARESNRNFDSTMHVLIGDGGLTTTSGIDSLWGYLEGRSGVPPMVKVLGDLLMSPVSDKALNEFLKRDVFTVVPAAEAARYLTDDIVYRGFMKDDSKPARNLFMRADGERRKAPLTMLKGWLAGEPE